MNQATNPAHEYADRYEQRKHFGARLIRAGALLEEMKAQNVPDADGPAFLRACRRVSLHCSQHAIETDKAHGGKVVASNIAVPEGGPTSRIARQLEPFVVSPEQLTAQKIS